MDKYLDIPLNHPKLINQHLKHSGVQKFAQNWLEKWRTGL